MQRFAIATRAPGLPFVVFALGSIASVAQSANADPPHVPSHLPMGAPRVAVVTTHGASATAARAEVSHFTNAVATCVLHAHERDPSGLAAVRVAVAIVRLRRDGQTDAVEITPSHLAHGLSQCIATELLSWRQTGYIAPHGMVQLIMNLEP